MPYLTTNNIRTFYQCTGDGPPLLLIAGNGMDHTTFNEQLPRFSKHFRCIVYDLRGVGLSDIPDDGYTVKEMATDALGLLDGLDIRQAHIAGYSLGGAIALEIALQAASRVDSLSLYASYDRPDPYLKLRYDILIKVVEENDPELWALFSAYSAFGEGYVNAHEAGVRSEIDRRIARARHEDQRARIGLAGHYRAILSHDVSDRIQSIRVPTWIAVGGEDHVMPPHYARRLNASIPNSEMELFPDRPHRLLNFHAESFTNRALDFLLHNR